MYISLKTWYKYKIDIKYDNINYKWEWRVNGVPQPDTIYNNNTLTGTHYNGIQIWELGFSNTGQTYQGTIYFDLVKVNTMSYQ